MDRVDLIEPFVKRGQQLSIIVIERLVIKHAASNVLARFECSCHRLPELIRETANCDEPLLEARFYGGNYANDRRAESLEMMDGSLSVGIILPLAASQALQGLIHGR